MEEVKGFGKKEVVSMLKQIALILVGTFIMAFGFMVFLEPYSIVPGGFMGIAQILYDVLSGVGFSYIPLSAWYIILNLFLFIYAVKVLGFKFGLRAGVGILSYSLFVELIGSLDIVAKISEQFAIESSSLEGVGLYILYALYGGLLMGVGIGFVFRGEGSTGGCDMVAVVVNKFFPTITNGQIIMAVDGCVVLASAIAYGSIVLPLFALITIFVSGRMADMFVDGVRSLRAYYILTDKKEEMSNRIMTEIERGVTNIKCEGMYTKKDKDMLLVILRRTQIMKLKKIVKEVDINSFMFSSTVKEAYGQGFFAYEIDDKKKKSKQIEIPQEERVEDKKEVVVEKETLPEEKPKKKTKRVEK